TWRCNNINKKHDNLCLPPRREHMCIKKINDMMSSTVDNKDKLLNAVMEAAKDEAIDILKKLKPEKETEFSNICDAMKYSFADIGDIIRGRDLWNNDRKNESIQRRLDTIFRNIYDQLKNDKNKYNQDGARFYKLREEWWNTNRKNIWKAMTCVAPNDAKFKKKKDETGTTTTTSAHVKCGHNKITPVDDYIPQPFRWLTEWSEYYCKASSHVKCGHLKTTPVDDYIPQPFRWLTEWSEYYCKGMNKKLAELKGKCETCTSGSPCKDDQDGKICEECKEKCTSFGKFVKEWQQKFNIQSTIYNELYQKSDNASTNNTNNSFNRSTKRNRRRTGIVEDDDNKRTDNFLKQVKNKCGDDAKTAEQYLDKTTKCIPYKFTKSDAVAGATSNDDNYAFNDKPPKPYENKCECERPDPLDKCPDENTNTYEKVCKNLSITKTCINKNFNNDLDSWTPYEVKELTGNNKGVLVPPRRRKLCLRNITTKLRSIKNKDNFKKILLDYVFTEGKFLGEKYKNQPTKALEAMKYSFADYGDIIKGTDMIEGILVNDLNDRLNKIFSNNDSTSTNTNDDQKQWWDNNKKHVWHAMLCGYKSENKSKTLDNTWCPVPKEDDTPQFLRWLEEWAKIFCDEKQKEAKTVVDQCLKKLQEQKPKTITEIGDKYCKQLLNKYRDWYLNRNRQWKGLKEAYEKYKDKNGSSGGQQLPSNVEDYVKSKCSECNCNYDDLQKISDYQDKENELFKELVLKAQIDSIHPKDTAFYKFFTLRGFGPEIAKKAFDAAPGIISKVSEYGVQSAKNVLNELKEIIDKIKSSDSSQTPAEPPPAPATPPSPRPPVTPQGTQHDEPINSEILSSTLPVGISFALGSIALLFYLKKNPKLGPTKLFRVIDIPQNDYGIPDKTSTNRYVPYGKYKGKTYIYMERDTEDDKYMFTSDTTDVTSSESEYEEIDINDIYPYKSPKYKTLIEVVLKPSSKAHDDKSMYKKDDSNKLTDEEWNQLKQDFISQYLQNIQKDLPNEDTIDKNIYKNTQINILDVNIEEKPFITQIQDRKLYSDDNEIIYNIDWNVPKNISTNTTDDSKYVSNDQYTGIDLINDSLNSGNDIYDELLKRKENELYGTKHPNNISTNRGVKGTHSDPINNQIDLFHKWLDRHRDMCNKWNNKEEMLNQLNEEWNNENKEHVLYTSTIDDINRINDENYNMINANTNEHNHITSLEDFCSTNIPPNDLITKNNGSQTKNLRTNISMDIHFDENNNNVTNEDDQLENSYNL
ncbi:putative EMP1-like protein, partial [Plasmodium gaboni]